MLTYLHPISAAVVLALLVWVGSLGLRARNQPRRARALLARHARWAPLAYALVLATWVTGIVTTWALRRDLEVAASEHFRFGILLVLALTGAWATARRMHVPWIREVHPWFGAAALLLAAAQVLFGLQITP